MPVVTSGQISVFALRLLVLHIKYASFGQVSFLSIFFFFFLSKAFTWTSQMCQHGTLGAKTRNITIYNLVKPDGKQQELAKVKTSDILSQNQSKNTLQSSFRWQATSSCCNNWWKKSAFFQHLSMQTKFCDFSFLLSTSLSFQHLSSKKRLPTTWYL